MDWRELFRNKWMLAGLGVAGAAGLFVLYRRSQAGGGTAQPESRSSPAYGGGGIGTFDSTGTDVAAWLGNQTGFLQNQFNEFLSGLDDRLDRLAPVPTKPAPIPTPSPGRIPSTTPKPPAPAPRKPVPDPRRYVTVVRYTKTNAPWNSTLSGIARHEGTSVTRLLALNPSIKNANLIYPNQRIRVA